MAGQKTAQVSCWRGSSGRPGATFTGAYFAVIDRARESLAGSRAGMLGSVRVEEEK